MTSYIAGRVWLVWLALVLATMFSWWTAAGHVFESSALRIGGAVTVAIGFVKVWLIGMHFMDLRHAAPLLRRAFHAWAMLVGGLVVALVLC